MLPPLLFTPIYRRYLWGGRALRRFSVVTSPRGTISPSRGRWSTGATTRVSSPPEPLAGRNLGDLVTREGRALLGRHAGLTSFPLLFKFLDACRDLSVQVHPDDDRAARLDPPDKGKTEAWYVIDAVPGSRLWAGLKAGVDRESLAAAAP